VGGGKTVWNPEECTRKWKGKIRKKARGRSVAKTNEGKTQRGMRKPIIGEGECPNQKGQGIEV